MCASATSYPTQIEEVVGLEQKVVDLQHENRRLQGVGDALRQQLNQQEGTHSFHLQALQDGEERQAELVQTLQDKVDFAAFCIELHTPSLAQ